MYSVSDLQNLVQMLSYLGITPGTGAPAHSVVLGGGTNAAPGAAGTLLVSNGAAADPSFQGLPANSVGSSQIQNGAVGSSELANGAVGSSALASSLALGTVTASSLQDLGGQTIVGATGAGNSAIQFRYDGLMRTTVNGTAGWGGWHTVLSPEIWITDAAYGGVMNNSGAAGANVTAWNSAVAALGSAGGTIFFPDGDFYINAALVVNSNKAVVVRGNGSDVSRIIQLTANAYGLDFTTGSSMVPGSSANASFTVRDIALVRSGTSGGLAIHVVFPTGTDNRPHFTAQNVQIYSDNSTTLYWAKGIELNNCNGSRIDTVSIKGDINSTSSGSLNPYGMTQAIHYQNISSNVNGLIDHFLSNLSGGECGAYMQVDGWHEGFYIDRGELVHVAFGFVVNGYSVSNNPNFVIGKVHCDHRGSFIKATNCDNVWLCDCDAYKDGGLGGGTGYATNIIELNGNCRNFSMTSGKITNTQTASGSNGVYCSPGGAYGRGRMNGVLVNGMNTGGTGLSHADAGTVNWNVGGNTFYSCTTGIYENGSTNYIADDNIFVSCTTKINNSGAGNRIPAAPSF